jgi:DNA-binding MarR family transcriptional regulator
MSSVVERADAGAGAGAGESSQPARAGLEDCPECLRGNLNWLLTQAHYALASELAAAFEPIGITPRGHAVLGAARTGAHTQKALADLVGLDKTTMVATLDELELAGLARRVPSPGDRRAHVVEVTGLGERRLAAAGELIGKVQADVLGSLEPQAASALIGALSQLVGTRLAEPAACKQVRRREPRAGAA